MTAGDLGISASEVEKNLGAVLELCQTCKCGYLPPILVSLYVFEADKLIVIVIANLFSLYLL